MTLASNNSPQSCKIWSVRADSWWKNEGYTGQKYGGKNLSNSDVSIGDTERWAGGHGGHVSMVYSWLI